MNNTLLFTDMAIGQWELQVRRAGGLIDKLSDQALLQPIAPDRNTGTYVVGHLIAIHDAIPEILSLGDRKYPELNEIYIKQPDGAVSNAKSVTELRALWAETHERVTQLLRAVPAEDWLKRHAAMTDEDFEANPMRNRLSVLLARTGHLAYHLGQLQLLSK